jgi:antitoxin MazE
MRTKLVSIGNSKGIRIPSSFLKQCGIDNIIDIDIKEQRIIINPVKKRPREGWEKAFNTMHANGDDSLLIDGITDSFEKDWEWK